MLALGLGLLCGIEGSFPSSGFLPPLLSCTLAAIVGPERWTKVGAGRRPSNKGSPFLSSHSLGALRSPLRARGFAKLGPQLVAARAFSR